MSSVVIEKGKEQVSKLLDLTTYGIGKKIFDNIVWVFIIMGLLTIVYILYLMKRSFNVANKIRIIDEEYAAFKKNVNLDEKSESGKEEKYDEIEPDKHTLCDTYIISSAKSYLVGWSVADFVSSEMVFSCIKYGARYIEIDINLNKNSQMVIANGIKEGKWILNFNEIPVEEFFENLGKKMFNEEYFINNKDPLILYINSSLPKNRMNLLHKIIYSNLKIHLLDKEYNVDSEKNVLDLPLDQLYKKVILIFQGKIAGTDMTKIVNLKLGDRVKRLTFDELLTIDTEESIQFNKKNLTIVEPNFSIKRINGNPREAFDRGCQIMAMNFQRADTYMVEYLSMFYGKSFQLKPFEFTGFSDTAMMGYDQNKIAFLFNKEEYKNEEKVITNQNAAKKDENCCYLILDNEMENYYPGAVETDMDLSIIQLQNSVNLMEVKLKQLGINLDDNTEMIQSLSVNNETNINTIKDFMKKNYIKEDPIVNSSNKKENVNNKIEELVPAPAPAPAPAQEVEEDKFIYLKFYALYNYIMKQLRKELEKARKIEFSNKEFQDPCFSLDKNKCQANPLCFYGKNQNPEQTCKPKTSLLPFPELCVPKHELNRDNCFGDEKYSNFGLRKLYHKIHTQKNFAGNWSSAKGVIEISDEFDDSCQFKFTTPHDQKEFTMFIVDENGDYISLQSMTGYKKNDDTIRAKGTFVDPELRELEKRNNLPELPYHGFADMQMSSNDEFGKAKDDTDVYQGNLNPEKGMRNCQYKFEIKEGETLKKNDVKNIDAFKGIYKYSSNVYRSSNPTENTNIYKNFLDNKYGLNDSCNLNTLYIGSYNETDTKKQYCYKMVNAECNNDLQTFFGRDIQTTFAPVVSEKPIQFDNIDEKYIDDVFKQPPSFEEFTGSCVLDTWQEENQNKILESENGFLLGANREILYGKALGNKGLFLNTQGQLVNDKGQLVNNKGELVNEKGQFVNEKGKLINARGQLVNEKGQLVNEKGQVVNEKGQLVNETGELVDDKGKVIKKKEEEKKEEKKKEEEDLSDEDDDLTITRDSKTDRYVNLFMIGHDKDKYCLGIEPNSAPKCKKRDGQKNSRKCYGNPLFMTKCVDKDVLSDEELELKEEEIMSKSHHHHFYVKEGSNKSNRLMFDIPEYEFENLPKRPKMKQGKIDNEAVIEYNKKLDEYVVNWMKLKRNPQYPIGYVTGLYQTYSHHLNSKRNQNGYFRDLKIEKIPEIDKYSIKTSEKHKIASNPKYKCKEFLSKKSGSGEKCLTFSPFCHEEMEKMYEKDLIPYSKIDEGPVGSDEEKYIYNLHGYEMGNVEWEKCNPTDKYQQWTIKQVKKEIPNLDTFKMSTSPMEELKKAEDACSKAKDVLSYPAKDICAGKPR